MDYRTSCTDAYEDSQRIRAELEAAGVFVQGISFGDGFLVFHTDGPIPAELQATLDLTEA